MAQIEDILFQKRLIDYTQRVQEEVRPLAELFPEQKVDELVLELFKAANDNIADVASIHAFGAKAEERQSKGVSFDLQEMFLVKQAVAIKEKDLIALENTISDTVINSIKDKYLNELIATVRAVLKRFEVMRGEILHTGKLVVNENGYKGTIDYKMPAQNFGNWDFTDESKDPLQLIDDAMEYVENLTEVRPTRVITSKKNIRALVQHPKVRSAFYGTEKDRIITMSKVNQVMEELDMPTFGVYREKYKKLQKNGKYKTDFIIPQDKLILLPPTKVGDTFYGPTAEGRRLRKHGIETKQDAFVTTAYAEEINPPEEKIISAATGLVSAPYIDQVYVATVTSSKD